MNYLAQLRAFYQVHRATSYDASRLKRMQWQKLKPLVADAYASIPFYRQRLDQAGVTPMDLRNLDDLSKLPLLTKADFQAAAPETLISTRIARSKLHMERTSGSSGRPFEMHFDDGYRRIRKALFLRALMSCGYRPGQKLLLVTTREKRGVPDWMGWHYASFDDAPMENVRTFNTLRPPMLYGWVTPIRQMAEAARASNVAMHRPKALITTAETLDANTRQLLSTTFNCPVYEIYGLTETGALAWQSPGHAAYRVSHESIITEFLPSTEGGHAKRLIVTNLALRSMPFIRYDTGDLVVPTATADNGQLPGIEKVEGRLVDCIRLSDGRVVPPFQLTTAMEDVPGVVRYQIVQEELSRIMVRYEATARESADTVNVAQRVIRNVLGDDVQVTVQREANLDPPPGRKFRVVESRLNTRGAV